LPFFPIFHIFSLFNLLLIHIFRIFSQFSVFVISFHYSLFFPIFPNLSTIQPTFLSYF
jgi:hypothetical protein